MRHPFRHAAKVLLNYKRQMVLAFLGALLSALCFGGGIATVLPVLQALIKGRNPIRDLIVDNLLQPERPVWVRELAYTLIDKLPSDPFYSFLMVLMAIVVLTIVGSVGRYVHELMTLTVVARGVMIWRARVFKRLIHAKFAHVLRTGTSDPISRVLSDTRTMGRGFHALMGKAVAKLLNGAVAVAVALYLDWHLTLIALVAAPFSTTLLRKFSKMIRRASKRLMKQRAHMLGMLHESLDNIRTVKTHTAEGYERRRFGQLNKAVFGEEMKLRQIRALSGPTIETLGLIGTIAAAAVAAWYIFRQGVPPERFMAVLVALSAAASSLKPLSTLNNQVSEARAAAERVMQAVETPTEPNPDEFRHAVPHLPPHTIDVRFENVQFAYPGAEAAALDGVTLDIPHGKTVAVVGPNGSGKTTLLSLLPRLIEPTGGRVLIDGIDIAHVRLRSLRRQIAVVSQQTVLFEGTIAENIAYGRRHVPMDRIIAAAEAAHADEFIRALPEGYETMLGESGTGLSGGQGQRLCIARAILRSPSILILDEATSQVDADSEKNINEAVNELRHGRTTFIIAHRLSTVVDADLIVVMDEGRIVDQGVHDELLERCDIYRTLTHTQLHPAYGRRSTDRPLRSTPPPAAMPS